MNFSSDKEIFDEIKWLYYEWYKRRMEFNKHDFYIIKEKKLHTEYLTLWATWNNFDDLNKSLLENWYEEMEWTRIYYTDPLSRIQMWFDWDIFSQYKYIWTI